MASQQPIFELVMFGSGTVGTDIWVDLGIIPSGKQILLGYATYVAIDKNTQFETRSNLEGYSDGTTAHTELHDWTSTASGTSIDRDFYMGGNVNTLTVIGSNHNERLWLHITAQAASAGAFDYIIRYTQQ